MVFLWLSTVLADQARHFHFGTVLWHHHENSPEMNMFVASHHVRYLHHLHHPYSKNKEKQHNYSG